MEGRRKMAGEKKENQKRIISIKVKLLGIILPVVIVIMMLLVGTLYFISKSIIKEHSEDLLSSSIENQTNQIEAWLNENLSAFRAVKQSIEQTNPDQQQLQAILDSYYGYNDNYPDGLYIADENGRLLTASDSEKAETDPTQSVWYREGLTRWNMGLTNAYTNAKGENVISASGILDDQSGTIKVISADLTLERISIIVNSYIEMDQARAFLVSSSDGTILAHQESGLISTKLGGSKDVFLQNIWQKVAQYDFDMVEMDNNITAFSQIQGTDWVLVSYIPTKVIYADIDRVRNIMLVIGLVSLILLAVLVERVVHIVIRPVKELIKVITAMTGGDFTVTIESAGNDEIGVMSRHVQQFILTMRQMIASIHTVSDKLSTQAGDSDTISREMYDATKLQGQSMRELNTTVEQLSMSVGEIANHATTLAMVVSDTKDDGDQVDSKMQETVKVSQNGKSDLQRVNSAMGTINGSVQKLQQSIDEVGKASAEITNITEIIGNIADQTALLSLNASIEAARAGEAGRGFAVVATEIGQLAYTSADAVRNIEGLVSQINSLVGDTVKQTRESVDTINHSSELVEDTLRTFDSIFGNIDQVSMLVGGMIKKVEKVDDVATNVAAISEEQAASSEEILATSETMVRQVDNITNNSERVSAGAKELTSSAEELYEQVARFKIGEEAGK